MKNRPEAMYTMFFSTMYKTISTFLILLQYNNNIMNIYVYYIYNTLLIYIIIIQ